MSGGGGGGNLWQKMLAGGVAVCGGAYGLEAAHVGGHLGPALLLGLGGLMLVFGSCEAMILSVEALGIRMRWNEFVAGTMAGLASNVPEIIMLGFVVAKEPARGVCGDVPDGARQRVGVWCVFRGVAQGWHRTRAAAGRHCEAGRRPVGVCGGHLPGHGVTHAGVARV